MRKVSIINNKKAFTLFFMCFAFNSVMAIEPVLKFEEYKPVSKEWKGNWLKKKDPLTWNILGEDKGEITAYTTHDDKFELIKINHDFDIKAKVLLKYFYPHDIFVNDNINIFTLSHGKFSQHTFDSETLDKIGEKDLFSVKTGKDWHSNAKIEYSPNKEFIAVMTRQWKNVLGFRENFTIRLFNKNSELIAENNFVDFKEKGFGKTVDYCYANDFLIEDNGEVFLTCSSFNLEEGGSSFVVKYISKEGIKEIDFGKLGYVVNKQDILSKSNNHLLMLLKSQVRKDAKTKQKVGGEMHIVDFNLESKAFREVDTLCYKFNDTSYYVTELDDGSYKAQKGREFIWFEKDGKSKYFKWDEERHQEIDLFFWKKINEQTEKLSFFKDGRMYVLDIVGRSKGWVSQKGEYRLVLKSYDKNGNYEEQLLDENLLGNLYFHKLNSLSFIVWEQNARIDKNDVQRLGTLTLKD